jgi:hypothetical protein
MCLCRKYSSIYFKLWVAKVYVYVFFPALNAPSLFTTSSCTGAGPNEKGRAWPNQTIAGCLGEVGGGDFWRRGNTAAAAGAGAGGAGVGEGGRAGRGRAEANGRSPRTPCKLFRSPAARATPPLSSTKSLRVLRLLSETKTPTGHVNFLGCHLPQNGHTE